MLLFGEGGVDGVCEIKCPCLRASGTGLGTTALVEALNSFSLPLSGAILQLLQILLALLRSLEGLECTSVVSFLESSSEVCTSVLAESLSTVVIHSSDSSTAPGGGASSKSCASEC